MKTWMFQKGIQNQLYRELLLSDPDEYRRLLRLSCVNSSRSCWRSWGQRLPEKTLSCAEASRQRHGYRSLFATLQLAVQGSSSCRERIRYSLEPISVLTHRY
ncbi:hypothetical protein MTO96_035801 [Rhipicephalus appendiculatus]